MYRQLFIEYNSQGKPIKGYIFSFNKDEKLTDFEKKLNIDIVFLDFHIPLIFNISTIKRILLNILDIDENILLFSNRFNIEIGYINEKIIFSPFRYQLDGLMMFNENRLFNEIGKSQVSLTDIIFCFIRQSQLKLDIKSFIHQPGLYNLDYDIIIDSFKEYSHLLDYSVNIDHYYNILQKLSIDEILFIADILKSEGWSVSGILKYKSNVLIIENNVSNLDNIVFENKDEFIIITKKKIIFKKLSTLSKIRILIPFLNMKEVIKTKTRVLLKNYSLSKNINPILKIFLLSDPIIKNIKKTFDENIKAIINKNDIIFFSDNVNSSNIIYLSKFIFSMNIEDINLKRKDKLRGFFISRTCQNLTKKKRAPIVVSSLPDNIEKETDRYYKNKNNEYYFDDIHYYSCDKNNDHRYIGFLTRFADECVPCCYLKNQESKEIFKNCISTDKIDDIVFSPYPLSEKRLISNKNQLKKLPSHIDFILNKKNKILYKNERISETSSYILLTYSDLNDKELYSEKDIFENYIIITKEKISFNYENLNFEKVVFMQSNNYERLIAIKKEKNNDQIELEELNLDLLKDYIFKKLNLDPIFHYKNITVNNLGVFIDDKKIHTDTKFLISIADVIDDNIIKNTENFFKNIIDTENYDFWSYIKCLSTLFSFGQVEDFGDKLNYIK